MKLARVLAELTGELEKAGMAHAVIGGLAASARGEARFTRDVDVAVLAENDGAAEQCIHRFVRRGYVVVATVEQDATHRLATARLRHPGGIVCDLIFATSGIERETVQSADRIEVFPDLFLPTASAEAIVAMKVLSATPQRPRDRGDIQAILRANPDLDAARVVSLLELISTRGYSRGQNLAEKWRKLRGELGEHDVSDSDG